MRAAAEKKNECKATTCDAASLFFFLASLLPRCAFSPSPSGCSALTGGFSRVMTATPPSISRVAVGGAAMLEKTKRRARKKKEVEMATVPSSFSHSLSCSPSTLSPSLSRPSFPKTPPPKNPPLSPRSPRLFPNARAARAALSVCESRGCGARPSGRVGGAEGEAFSVSFGNPSSLPSLEEEKGEKEKGGKERR